jgi:hypothetical protein
MYKNYNCVACIFAGDAQLLVAQPRGSSVVPRAQGAAVERVQGAAGGLTGAARAPHPAAAAAGGRPRGVQFVRPVRTAVERPVSRHAGRRPAVSRLLPLDLTPAPCPPYSYVYTRSRHPLVSAPPALPPVSERADGRTADALSHRL